MNLKTEQKLCSLVQAKKEKTKDLTTFPKPSCHPDLTQTLRKERTKTYILVRSLSRLKTCLVAISLRSG